MTGSLFLRGQRYYWHGRLPNADKYITVPLKPVGSRYATKDIKVATEIVKMMIKKALFKQETKKQPIQTVNDLIVEYVKYAKIYYSKSKEPSNIYTATQSLIGNNTKIDDFTAQSLILHREKLIADKLCRNVINQRISIIKRMFRWAVSQETCSAYTLTSLNSVESLKRGRSEAKETESVKPARLEDIEIAIRYATPTVAAMLRLQTLTGMRSGELVIMRTQDIDTTGEIWAYNPYKHKTDYLGHKRAILIGGQGQEVLKPFMDRIDYCFKPIDSIRQLGLKPRGGLSPHYSTSTYHNAVKDAVKKAKEDKQEIQVFSPHQIRHTAATEIRKRFGLDAVRAVLGHKSLKMADEYAEIDKKLAENTAKQIG